MLTLIHPFDARVQVPARLLEAFGVPSGAQAPSQMQTCGQPELASAFLGSCGELLVAEAESNEAPQSLNAPAWLHSTVNALCRAIRERVQGQPLSVLMVRLSLPESQIDFEQVGGSINLLAELMDLDAGDFYYDLCPDAPLPRVTLAYTLTPVEWRQGARTA